MESIDESIQSQHSRFSTNPLLENFKKSLIGNDVVNLLEEKARNKMKCKLKVVGYFFITLSIYILLNCAIGFSSAPFYERLANCNRNEPTPECSYVEKLSEAIYFFELVGGMFLLLHGLLIVSAMDYLTSYKFARAVDIYTKVVIVIYVIVIICRIGIYAKLADEIPKIDPAFQNSWGAFLGAAADTEDAAVGLTFFFMTVFLICMCTNMYFACCVSRKLVKCAKSHEQKDPIVPMINDDEEMMNRSPSMRSSSIGGKK